MRPSVLIVILAMLAGGAQAQTEARSDKHDLARELIETTGAMNRSVDILDAVLPPLFDIIKRSNPGVSDATLDELKRLALEEYKASLPELIDPIATVYESNYSEDELRQLIDFYKSPLGRKTLEKMPVIFRQSQAIGAVWGKKIGESVVNRIKTEAKKKGLTI
jgi:hypothetical protein